MVAITKRWLSTKEAAEYVGFSTATLYGWRYGRGDIKGPRSFKVGGQLRYRIEDLDEWLSTNERPGDVEANTGAQ
jgi:excisionase family DNA binding protein